MTEEDPNIATRAPESDFHESHSTFPNPEITAPVPPTSTTSQPQLSEHCTTSAPLPSSLTDTQPSGQTTSFHPKASSISEINAYVSHPSDYPSTPAKLLLLLSNGTGHTSLNNQLQADTFARHGYLTVMPDLFEGDPAPNTAPAPEADDPEASWLESLKAKVGETAKSFMLDMWLARQTSEKVLPRVKAVLQCVREEFADAVEQGGGVYVVGYCFGGKYALILAGESQSGEGQKSGPDVKCAVCAHGTLVERDDVLNVRAPVSLICVEEDPLFPAEVLETGRKKWQETAVEHEIEVYKGVPHGFAVLGEYGSQTIAEAQKKAFDQTIKWLDGH